MVINHCGVDKYLEKLSENLSYIAFLIFALQRYIGSFSQYGVYLSWFLMIILPFCYPITNIKPQVLLIPCLLIIYPYNSSIISLYFLFSFIFLFHNKPIMQIARLVFIIDLLIFILLPYFLGLNIIEDKMELMVKGETHTLGFGNPNSLGLTGFYLLFPIYILFYRSNRILTIIILIIIASMFYEISHSRTSFMSSIVFIFFVIIYRFNLLNTYYKYIIAILPIIFTAVIFYIVFHANQYVELDILSSSRISILSNELENFNTINFILGKRIKDAAMDCAYIGAVFQGGIFYLIGSLGIISINVIKKYKYIKFYIPIIISMLISGITETTFTSPTCASVLFWTILINKYHGEN